MIDYPPLLWNLRSSAKCNIYIISITLAYVLVACGTESNETEEGTEESLFLSGNYTDNYEGDHQITSTEWIISYMDSTPSRFLIEYFSNVDQVVIAQNSEDNEFSASKWSRFDWTQINGVFWFCQTSFNSESKEAALEISSADATEPMESGCGDFAWTELQPHQ